MHIIIICLPDKYMTCICLRKIWPFFQKS